MSDEHHAAPRTALVICYSRLESDPRVVRQIEWLMGAGWVVDTLGFGPAPTPDVRRHFELGSHTGVRRNPLARLALHAALPHGPRFRALDGALIPRELTTLRDAYDLVVANELELLPWVVEGSRRLLRPGGRLHLDVHEYHRWEARGRGAAVRRLLFAGYHRWLVSLIGSPLIDSRTTVSPGIAELYATDFGIAPPTIVRNSPAFVDQRPSAVARDLIRMIYHGHSDPSRGIDVLIDAVALLPDRFRLTLMLTGSEADRAALAVRASELPGRVEIVPPVPMLDIARSLNPYDLEIILFAPTTPNFRFVLPNKLFEAIQGRLAVVIGPSPSMMPVVSDYGIGVVTGGWTAAELAEALADLTADDIMAFKTATERAARELNADVEGRVFLQEVWPG
jgi:glycosyltransferase involved in cell wall biosynthesis